MRRRDLLSGAVSLCALSVVPAFSAPSPKITVTKDPSCGCCNAWAEHLRSAGYSVEIVTSSEIGRVKARLGVPRELASCHTAEVEGYVVEGHVPAAAVSRLLVERPKAKGLAVPNMPVGSPGMEVAGSTPDEYIVFAFGEFGTRPFAKYKGLLELKL